MVSFSCEACGDVLTKKKLDSHHRQCQGSSFTCLDCMTHFRGTDFRTHTSCVSEEQKYQGALYKDKPAKHAKKSVKISEPISKTPRKAYIEDAFDEETGNAVSIVVAPPAAPTPPSAIPPTSNQPINVFDFLVSGDTPNASKTSLEETKESLKMVEQTPSNDGNTRRDAGLGIYDGAYERNGFSYGTEPVPVAKERSKVEYFTPASKSLHMQNQSTDSLYNVEDSERRSTDKKRKRVQAEEPDFTTARRPDHESDLIMADAPPAVLHSGLTGGLGRLLTKSKFSPRSELSDDDPDPPSPVKRTIKPASIKDKSRGRKAEPVLVKVSKRRSSDESRPRKHRRSHHHESDKHTHHDHRPKRKAIEYHTQSSHTTNHSHHQQQQLILFKTRAELFSSFVTKGPDSEQGYSLHKALKRYHRERGEEGLGMEKADEERELFKALRLRRNDRGEIVVFY
ncbi:hypothetical protein BDR22DRAFT_876219 [Usnea florida]